MYGCVRVLEAVKMSNKLKPGDVEPRAERERERQRSGWPGRGLTGATTSG